VREFARKHIADDFHVAMGMRSEAGARLDAILVDDAQRAELDELRIAIIGERETVERLQPAVIGETSFVAAADGVHGGPPDRSELGSLGLNSRTRRDHARRAHFCMFTARFAVDARGQDRRYMLLIGICIRANPLWMSRATTDPSL
jgi:hypothetical protein